MENCLFYYYIFKSNCSFVCEAQMKVRNTETLRKTQIEKLVRQQQKQQQQN